MQPHCIFNTEADAQAYADGAYAHWMMTHINPDYAAGTTKWAVPFQRLTDSKWCVPACPACDNSSQTVENSQSNWFPEATF